MITFKVTFKVKLGVDNPTQPDWIVESITEQLKPGEELYDVRYELIDDEE